MWLTRGFSCNVSLHHQSFAGCVISYANKIVAFIMVTYSNTSFNHVEGRYDRKWYKLLMHSIRILIDLLGRIYITILSSYLWLLSKTSKFKIDSLSSFPYRTISISYQHRELSLCLTQSQVTPVTYIDNAHNCLQGDSTWMVVTEMDDGNNKNLSSYCYWYNKCLCTI